MKGSEVDLLEYGSLMKRGYGFAVANAGKIVALITAAVAALVIFTDVSFSGFLSESFCTNLAVLLLSSYVIYFSLEDAGERLGRESDEYRAALDSYSAAMARVGADDITELRSFCERYVSEELEYRRRRYIASRGFGAEEYAGFLLGMEVSAEAKRVFRGAKRLRPIELTPSMLMSARRVKADSGIGSSGRDRLASGIAHLLPSTLCTVFTVSVMLTAKDTLTAETVIDGLLKLSALPTVAFKGYSAGFCQTKDNETRYLQAKTRILEDFLSQKTE